MASAGDLYLPNLGDCFAGKALVISWTEILTEVVRDNIDGTSDRPLKFLSSTSANSILSLPKLLSNPIPTLPTPSAQSNADFESRTGAINITPSPGAPYSIDEIKDDTLWLSKTIGLDEIECLRITVLEWQTRPTAQLQQGLSETEVASLRDALGSDDYSYTVGQRDAAGPKKLADPSFDSQDKRRARLLTIGMQEQGSMFRISAIITDMIYQLLGTLSAEHNHHPAHTFGEGLRNITRNSLQSSDTQGALSACFDGLHMCLEKFAKGPAWVGQPFDSEELQDTWTCSYLHQLNSVLEMILLHHQSPRAYTDSSHVLVWLRLMAEINFFLGFDPQSPIQAVLCSKMQALASTCTLALLYLSTSSEYIERAKNNPEIQLDRSEVLPYFMDPDAAAEIHQLILSYAVAGVVQAAPAVLAWGLILGNIREVARASQDLREASHVQKAIDGSGGSRDSPSGRRLSSSSIGSFQQSAAEDVMDAIRSVSSGEDDVHFLTLNAVEICNVFQYMASISATESIRTSIGTIVQAETFQQLIVTSIAQLRHGYSIELMATQLALIDALVEVSEEFRNNGNVYASKIRSFHEESGVRDVLEYAASRFPYEALSFLQMCKSLARLGFRHDYITTFLQNIPTFTQAAAPTFSAYHTIREYENANLVSLDAHLSMLDASESQMLLDLNGHVRKPASTIPSGTTGEVISSQKPPVIKWLHAYSGFAFLGNWLEGFRCGQLFDLHPENGELESIATVIVELLSLTLSSTYQNSPEGFEDAQDLLKETATDLPDDCDLVSIVFDILEQQLQGLRHRKQNVQSCDLIASCLSVIATLLKLSPSRVWLSLSRSVILDAHGASGGVLAIIISIETSREDYSFQEAYTKLYHALLEDAVSRAVRHNAGPASNRVAGHNIPVQDAVPQRIVDSVMYSSTRIMMAVFQTAFRWKFVSRSQRISMSMILSQTFSSVLQYVYGVDDAPNSSTQLAAGLASSAAYIVESLRPNVDEASGPVCLLQWFRISWYDSVDLSDIKTSLKVSEQLSAICDITRTVLLAGKYLNQPQSALETQMLDALPVLIRLSTLNDSILSAILDVVDALLHSIPEVESPSMLGRLGSASSRAFLQSMSPTVRRPGHDNLKIKVWDTFTSLITHNQQWFSIILLTGSPPEIASKKPSVKCGPTKGVAVRGKPILTEALDQLANVEQMDMELATAILKFVVKSQTYRNWVTDNIQTHATLLTSLITFVSSMKPGNSNQLVQSQSNKIASLIVELAIVQLHYARTRRENSLIHKMIPLMNWLSSNAINVDGYNTSLHSNLCRNFAARYDTCTLAKFKRTQLSSQSYGGEFYYDVQLASKMLSKRDIQSRRPDFEKTFEQEIIRVNLNISLVDSQLLLLDSFQSFCIEHCTYFSQDRGVQKMMAVIVENLLNANTTLPPSEQMFETLFQTRAEFALVLIRRLAEIKSRGSEFTGLLSVAWQALRFRNASYEFAIDNDDLVYFRTTLAILLLALQFHTRHNHHTHDKLALVSTQRDPSSSIVLEVASIIVADGIKSVVSTIHDQAAYSPGQAASQDVDSKDVSTILMVLQTMLRLHMLPQIVSQLGSGFVASSTIQSCLLLYSWSHTLTTSETGDEPVYADLSLRFLVSLSALPQVAEELGVEGVLSRISAARITQLLRSVKGGACQLDKRPFVAALYGVWTVGFLPLCLNLLHSVGRAMAGEVASFLNQFPNQLLRASKAFSYHSTAGEPLTVALANEGATLALVRRMLTSYRDAGASAGVDAYDVPRLEAYDDQTSSVIEDVKEILVGGQLKVTVTPTSDKEIGWLDMKDSKGGNKLERTVAAELTNVLTCLSEDGR